MKSYVNEEWGTKAGRGRQGKRQKSKVRKGFSLTTCRGVAYEAKNEHSLRTSRLE
jgi:hypothetical protein